MTLAKYAKLRKLLYPTFQIKAIKLIEEVIKKLKIKKRLF